eukprot:CAMPEP_0176129404 /NCGR_PEP_ID=MMETSP0120_2-20121206/65430_1 /TAXON_ID=160619 /ORGANISM="Kryptoperidinium foliaceum, Strain CCMP 1326" /LENGTH=77 /DNA_ID=CAMNT_0017464593 /DNA_START=35 /DNA_END=265 /DNA_ORIENTATION=+
MTKNAVHQDIIWRRHLDKDLELWCTTQLNNREALAQRGQPGEAAVELYLAKVARGLPSPTPPPSLPPSTVPSAASSK